jgi:hypothetical protein
LREASAPARAAVPLVLHLASAYQPRAPGPLVGRPLKPWNVRAAANLRSTGRPSADRVR